MSNVVIACDGSEEAANAAKTAVALGVTKGANLCLVNALDLSGVTSLGMMKLSDEQRQNMLDNCKEKVLSQLEAELANAEAAKVFSRVVMNTPATAIVDTAEEEKADLIVLGRRGIGAIRAFFLGSVSQKVMEMTEIPALVVPQDFKAQFATDNLHFLVTTDFSDHANRAIDYAKDLGKELGAKITLLHVNTVVGNAVTEANDSESPKVTGVTDQVRNMELAKLHELAKPLKDAGLTVDCSIAMGEDVVDEVLKAQKQTKADIVIMGSKGRNAVERFFVGSFTINVIKRSDVPVITM